MLMWWPHDVDLQTDPRVELLHRQTGTSTLYITAHLGALWSWAMKHAPDGDLSRFQPVSLAAAAQWDGDPDRWVDALVDCGFLEYVHDTDRPRLQCAQWAEIGGRLFTTRKENRDRQRQHREAVAARAELARLQTQAEIDRLSQLCHSDVTVTSQARNSYITLNKTEHNITEHNNRSIDRSIDPDAHESTYPLRNWDRFGDAVADEAPGGAEPTAPRPRRETTKPAGPVATGDGPGSNGRPEAAAVADPAVVSLPPPSPPRAAARHGDYEARRPAPQVARGGAARGLSADGRDAGVGRNGGAQTPRRDAGPSARALSGPLPRARE